MPGMFLGAFTGCLGGDRRLPGRTGAVRESVPRAVPLSGRQVRTSRQAPAIGRSAL
jgi:hypothetical protein